MVRRIEDSRTYIIYQYLTVFVTLKNSPKQLQQYPQKCKSDTFLTTVLNSC
ncbi:protein of unknown function [Candidatus Nitrotoga arctica]|uniref:Uncharacterized protein n=1 Tax=Candidatus Nitrotoga arctica TaxID=453162 RepID=A0ABN8ALA3_9PROT|nr:protein of unknown function [Candidatus Nitrotoga arctica]